MFRSLTDTTTDGRHPWHSRANQDQEALTGVESRIFLLMEPGRVHSKDTFTHAEGWSIPATTRTLRAIDLVCAPFPDPDHCQGCEDYRYNFTI